MRTLLAVIFCGLAFAAASARADDLFVDNVHGDDARNGRDRVLNADLKGPVRSLARGLELARPGDRIVMADTGVPYRESVTVSGGRNNGLGSQPFVIEGNGAVLEGSDLVPPKAWEHFHGDLFRFRPPRCAFAQLFLHGPPVDRRYLDNTAGRLPNLAPHEWCLADGWIYFRVGERELPDEYPLSYAKLTVGITLYVVHDVVIRDLTVQGFQLDGINAHDFAKDCQLIGVIARGNGRAGIAVGGDFKRADQVMPGKRQRRRANPDRRPVDNVDRAKRNRFDERARAIAQRGHRLLRGATPDRHACRDAASYRDSVIVAAELCPLASAAPVQPAGSMISRRLLRPMIGPRCDSGLSPMCSASSQAASTSRRPRK